MTRFVFLSLFLFSSISMAALVNNTKWLNGEKSHMILQERENGLLTGTFSTHVGCDADKPLPLIGWITGHVISFTVRFLGCSAITAWAGDLSPDAQNITTLWTMVVDGKPQWSSFEENQDIFIKQ